MAHSSREPPGSATRSPVEPFALFGNETRVGILQALWDRLESGLGDNALAYSALFDTVDISTPRASAIISKTHRAVHPPDGGWVRTQAAGIDVRAVGSGTLTRDPVCGSTGIDNDCPTCGAPMQIEYEDELLFATSSPSQDRSSN